MTKDAHKARREIDILSKLLAEENITIVHDASAATASFYPGERKLVFPTYGDQISTVTQVGLSLHETGHATDTPVEVFELSKKYGHSLINILEDVRIEKIVKRKYPGSRKFFSKAYDELVLNHNFFGTASNENPFDFNHMGFLDRVNCFFKIGAKSLVEFNPSEQSLVDQIAAIETLDDLERVAALLKDIAEANTSQNHSYSEDENQPGDPDDDQEGSGSSAMSDDEESDDGEERSESGFSDGSDDSEEPDADGDDGEESDGSDSEESDGDDADGDDGEESDGDDADGDDGEESDGDDADGDDGDDADSSEAGDSSEDGTEGSDSFDPNDVDLDSDSLEESETERQARETLEKLATNAGSVGRIAKTSEIDDRVQPWQDIESWVDDIVAGNGHSAGYGWVSRPAVGECQSDLKKFRTDSKSILNKMVSAFNRQAAGTVRRRTSYKDTGVLDPMKMVHYKYNDNIFKRRAFVRNGKNHGVVLLVDLTASMARRTKPIMRQVVLMADFCRKVNLPFRVYGWCDMYLKGSFTPPESTTPRSNGRYGFSRRNFDGVALTELLSSEMPNNVLEKYSGWLLTGYGLSPGHSTPLVSAAYYALPVVAKFRREHNIDIMKFMLFTDGEGHTSHPDWGSDSYVDEQTGSQYSHKDLVDDFFAGSYDFHSDFHSREDQQLFFLSKVMKDRFNADTIFMFMNSKSDCFKRIRNGMFTSDEGRAARKSLKDFQIAKVAEREHFTFVTIADGYELASGKFEMDSVDPDNKRKLTTAFRNAGQGRKSSTLFATIAAESLAE